MTDEARFVFAEAVSPARPEAGQRLRARMICSGGGTPAPDPISAVGMPTHNQPSVLARGLRSYIENVLVHDRRVCFVVLDDSIDCAVRVANLAHLRRLRASYAVDIAYAGPQEKADFVLHLARKGLPRAATEFALAGWIGTGRTTGANRNALLLHTVGEPFLSADDDTICTPALPPEHRAGLRLTSDDPTELWFPDDASSFFHPPAPGPCVLALHETMLGRNVDDCIRKQGPTEIALDSMSSTFRSRLERGCRSILATWMGLAGDLGTPHLPSFLIRETGRTRERLLCSERSYRRVMTDRRAVRGAARAAITGAGSWMTTVTAYDHRDLLPPFLPLGRGQDTLFGALLDMIAPTGYVAYLPYTVAHRPELPRLGALQARHLRVHLFHAVLFCIGSLAGMAMPPDRAAALQTIGRHLCDLGSKMPAAELEDFIRQRARERTLEDLADCAELLRHFGFRPAYWARDLEAYMSLRREAMAGEDFAVPWDLASPGWSRAEILAHTQEIIRQYGELLLAWPDMIEATKQLKAQGVRLAREVR
jgi:hypothetical protein